MFSAKTIYQESLPIGAYTPFGDDINPKEDQLFESRVVVINDSNYIESRHLVETYLIQQGKFKGRMYHLFTWISGKNVINYTSNDYSKLSEFIDISFQFTIFMRHKDEILEMPISPDDRLPNKNN